MKYVLGIDIGTGSVKAVSVNLRSEPVYVSRRHYPVYSARPGYSEQDPDLIWRAFRDCIQEAIERHKESPLAICLSSAMHSLIPVDSNGDKLSDMMTWADSRSEAIAARLKSSPEAKEIYEITGMPLHAMSPLCKITWIRENDPGLFGRTYKFISIKEYIWFKLFGEYTIDYSVACAAGMFDIGKLQWSEKVMQIAGISEQHLSKPVDTDYSVPGAGLLKNVLPGIPGTVRFVIGASDGCLANLGSFALSEGVAALTIGTSGAVRIALRSPFIHPEGNTFSYYLDKEHFICGGPVNNGGNLLDWLMKDFLGKTPDEAGFEDLFRQIDSVRPGSEELIFLPYLHGERAPVWDSKSCGTFFGVRSCHGQAHFSRAVLEGLCYALYDVLLEVNRHLKPAIQINVSGGFVHSQTWMQILADICGIKLSVSQTEDASAVGAAFLAMKVMGLNIGDYPVPDQADQRIIEPDMSNHDLYRRNFLVFKSLYSDLKEAMHKLYLFNH